ncbi:MAG: hypothetical protein ACT452_16005 [Microthrixaceae bacterium]
MATEEEVFVDFSVDEVLALSDALALPAPPFVDAGSLGARADLRGELMAAGRRSLVARHVMTVENDSEIRVLPAVRRLFELLAEPGLLARTMYEEAGNVETRLFAAVPEVAIEHLPLRGEIHRLTPFETEQLLARILTVVQLDERPVPVSQAFELTMGDLRRSAECLVADRRADAISVITGVGVPPEAAEAFVAALVTRVSSAAVTLLYQPDEGSLQGGELAWLDGGESGLWLTPMPDDTPAAENGDASDFEDLTVVIAPTSTKWIADELLSYLPDQDRGSAAGSC